MEYTSVSSLLLVVYVNVSVTVICCSYFKLMDSIIHRILAHCFLISNSSHDQEHNFEDDSSSSILTDAANIQKTIQMIVSTPPTQEEREQALRDYKVTIEYKHLKNHAPGGVYLVPSMDSLRNFYGVIFVRRGPFTNGIFKFTLSLPPRYNDLNQHPSIQFLSSVYNPYVDLEGFLDIKTAYPRWDPSRHYLVTILTFLKKIFYAKTFDDAQANLQAKQLAGTDPEQFRARVDECVRVSQKLVYDSTNETTTIQFTEEVLQHRVLRDLMKANIKDPAQISKNTVLAMIDKASKV